MILNPIEAMQHNVELLSPFIATILVYKRRETNAANWITGGTVFFAQTLENRFLITADHLIAEIDDLRSAHEILICLGGKDCAQVDISDWVNLDRDKSVDICTIQVANDFDAKRINKRFFELRHWPHDRATQGDSAFIIGYPAAHRTGTESSVNIRISPISDFVTDVGPRRFTIADENNEREVLLNFENLNVPDHFGGMSGSPVFRMIENAQPEFIGIFSTGGDGLRGAFFCSHADFILPEGRLDFGRIPPR